MADNSPEKRSGCGLLNAVFGRRWPRRTTSTGSLPTVNGSSNDNLVKTPSTSTSKRRSNSAHESQFLEDAVAVKETQQQQQQQQETATGEGGGAAPPAQQKPATKPPQNQPKQPPVYQQQQTKKSDETSDKIPAPTMQGYVHQGKRVPKEAIGISGELESMIVDHQKAKGSSSLVRASSSNMMLFGNLGNIRQGGKGNQYDQMMNEFFPNPKPGRKEPSSGTRGKYPNSVMGNVVKKQNEDYQKPAIAAAPAAEPAPPTSFCRALSTRMDPETLKIMGNEDYKAGNFAEALALYDAAISIDPNKASYRSNKTAALTALGRILEAVFECREAIRIEPHYHRAHHRLANLYLRLGEVEKAIYHFKHAGPEADHVDITKAKSLQALLNKCAEVKRSRDWNSLIKETKSAITAGADSALQIYSLQAEALLKLNRHQEADEVLKNGPNFEVDDCTKFYGPIGNANLLVLRAQVNLALGRFEDALAAIQKASKLDSNNREVNAVMIKAKRVAAARSTGNNLFKQAKFSDACLAYGEGLEVDPYNSALFCNRAACRSKLGQYEKAIEDCNAALNFRPGYSKARLRRADCLAKMEKFEASIQDYEILKRELPDDDEVNQALLHVQAQLRKQRGES